MYEAWYDERKNALIDSFKTFLRFPSVSTDPARKGDVEACCHWVKDQMVSMGIQTEVWETGGHPLIFGHVEAGDACPTLLIYLHYDVQPEDPVDLWDAPPFEPTIKDNVIYARGAIDNKGQCWYTLQAVAAFIEKSGGVNIKILIEGEEEIGSLSLFSILEKRKDELAADSCVIVDIDIPSLEEPSIILGCRGVSTINVTVETANEDLHSGLFGGLVANPCRILAEALGSMWDEKGSVKTPSFYNGMRVLSREERESLQDPKRLDVYGKGLGITALHAEEGFDLFETNSLRPTIEINGFHGGYGGEGNKTVLPCTAHAKLSCRTIPGQNSEAILEGIKEHIQSYMPEGAVFYFSDEHCAPGYWNNFSSKFAQIVKDAYADVLRRPCGQTVSGGTIPVAPELAKVANDDVVFMGYAFADDGMHAPNEHFGLDRFKYGFLTVTQLLEKLK